jgi:hypothetical protein
MLTGTYLGTMDRKGRLVLPAPFRAHLREPVAVLAGPEQSLLLLAADHWRAAQAEGTVPRQVLALAYEEPLCPSTARFMVRSPLRDRNGWRAGAALAVVGCGPLAVVVSEEVFSKHGPPQVPGWATDAAEPPGDGLTLARGDVLHLLDLLGQLRRLATGDLGARLEAWQETLGEGLWAQAEVAA